jgi:plasmid stabilization system protein ParE
MKSAVIPQIRVEPELRAELESVLGQGETLTDFVEATVRKAEADVERLFEILLDRAEATEELDRARAAIDSIRSASHHRRAITPFSFRKAAQSPVQRELIIPFGGAGYVALYEIVSPSKVVVLAVRHQCEEDYH